MASLAGREKCGYGLIFATGNSMFKSEIKIKEKHTKLLRIRHDYLKTRLEIQVIIVIGLFV